MFNDEKQLFIIIGIWIHAHFSILISNYGEMLIHINNCEIIQITIQVNEVIIKFPTDLLYVVCDSHTWPHTQSHNVQISLQAGYYSSGTFSGH